MHAAGAARPRRPSHGWKASTRVGWNSPPHRENILRRGFDRFGFGIVAGDENTLYAVQTFAGGGTPRGSQPGGTEAVTTPEEQTAFALRRINKERRAQSRERLMADPALVRAASNLVPADRQHVDVLDLQGGQSSALPDGTSGEWRSLAAIVGRCGGCGTRPTVANIRSFVQQWLDDPCYRGRLPDGDLTTSGWPFGRTAKGSRQPPPSSDGSGDAGCSAIDDLHDGARSGLNDGDTLRQNHVTIARDLRDLGHHVPR